MSLIYIAKYVVFCDCTLLTLDVHVSGLIVHDDRDEGPMCFTVYSANLTWLCWHSVPCTSDRYCFYCNWYQTVVLWCLIMTEQQVKFARKDMFVSVKGPSKVDLSKANMTIQVISIIIIILIGDKWRGTSEVWHRLSCGCWHLVRNLLAGFSGSRTHLLVFFFF